MHAVAGVPGWADKYLGVAALLHALWAFLGMMWLATVHMLSVERQLEDLCRAAAQQESLHMKASPTSRFYKHCSAAPACCRLMEAPSPSQSWRLAGCCKTRVRPLMNVFVMGLRAANAACAGSEGAAAQEGRAAAACAQRGP